MRRQLSRARQFPHKEGSCSFLEKKEPKNFVFLWHNRAESTRLSLGFLGAILLLVKDVRGLCKAAM
jgi:hypothetical protein